MYFIAHRNFIIAFFFTLQIPRDEEGEPLYEDFICPKCSTKCYFLKLYPDTIWASNKQSSAPQAETTNSTVMNGNSSLGDIEKSENGALINHLNCEKTSDNENCPKDSVAPEKASLDDSSDGKCKLGMNICSNTPSADSEKKMPFFMSKSWREVICRCETCTDFYAQQGVAYLIDKEDSIEEYEKVAKQKREKKLEQQEGVEANFLNSLDHVQKIEILSGINDMKNELQSFLVKLSYLVVYFLGAIQICICLVPVANSQSPKGIEKLNVCSNALKMAHG